MASNVGAGLSDRDRDRLTKAGRRSGYERDFSIKLELIENHGKPSLVIVASRR